MIKKLSIKSVPVVIGIDDKGRIITENEWHGEINAETDSGFLYKNSLRTEDSIEEVVKAINIGLAHIIDDEIRRFNFLRNDEYGIMKDEMDYVILNKDLSPKTVILGTDDPIVMWDKVMIPAEYTEDDGEKSRHPELFVATLSYGKIVLVPSSPNVKLVKKIPKGTKLYLITPKWTNMPKDLPQVK